VWEWCADWYDSAAYNRYKIGNLARPVNGGSRVLRGGSWGNGNDRCFRAARRSGSAPDYRGNYDGFRCARAL